MIREALIWAGAADPAELFDKNKTEDPVVEGRRNLLAAWHETFGDEPVTVAYVIKRTSGSDNLYPSEDPLAKLKNAISDLLPHGRVTSKALGTTISKFKGRWFDRFQLQAVGAQNGVKLWRVMVG